VLVYIDFVKGLIIFLAGFEFILRTRVFAVTWYRVLLNVVLDIPLFQLSATFDFLLNGIFVTPLNL